MQELVDKIQEFTREGSPSVGQWIELGDIAKKCGVKKTEMEKMVEEALANPNISSVNEKEEQAEFEERKPEFVRDSSYERPSFEYQRDQFEEEMLKRREQENQMFKREEEPVFEQPEVVFPELKVEFGDNSEKEKDEQEDLKEEALGDVLESLAESAEKDSIPPMEEPMTSIESIPEPPSIEAIEVPEIKPQEFKVESEEPVMTFEDISKSNFDYNPEVYEAKLEQDDVADYIADAKKKDREEAEAEAIRIKKEKELAEKRKREKRQQEQAERKAAKSSEGFVSHSEAKKARTIGIVAIAVSLLIGFVGAFIGLYGLSLSNKLKADIEEGGNLYGDQIKQNVMIGQGLSIAGIVVGALRFMGFFSSIF